MSAACPWGTRRGRDYEPPSSAPSASRDEKTPSTGPMHDHDAVMMVDWTVVTNVSMNWIVEQDDGPQDRERTGEWWATVNSRSTGTGCPFCAGFRVISGVTDLETTDPHLAKKALGWDARSVSAGSHRRVWWRCKEGHDNGPPDQQPRMSSKPLSAPTFYAHGPRLAVRRSPTRSVQCNKRSSTRWRSPLYFRPRAELPQNGAENGSRS